MEPLTSEAFRDALRKGLGRAIRHLEQYGAAGLIEDILFAATHSLAHDFQSEGNRYGWVLRLIELTGNEGYFRDRILPALDKSREKDDLSLLFALACEFAEEGDEGARQVIYKKFDRQEVDEPWLGGTSLVALDGMNGFLHIDNVIGARLGQDPAYRQRLEKSGENAYMLSIASDVLDKSVMLATREKRAETNEAVRLYLELSRKELADHGADRVSHARDSTPITAKEIIDAIENLRWNRRYDYFRFGRQLSPDDANQIFEALLRETRNEQRLRYLWLFPYGRTFPRLDEQLFSLVKSEDPRISKETLSILARHDDPRLREFAIDYLAQPGAKLIPGLIGLFEQHYQPGDAAIIVKVLELPDEPDVTHYLVMDIESLCPSGFASEMRDLWLWAYEHSPCSFCREGIVRRLIETKLAPRELLWECLEDCNDETRQLAHDAMAGQSAN